MKAYNLYINTKKGLIRMVIELLPGKTLKQLITDNNGLTEKMS